jgi:hypothetical protein
MANFITSGIIQLTEFNCAGVSGSIDPAGAWVFCCKGGVCSSSASRLIVGTGDLPPTADLPPAGSMLTRGDGEGVNKEKEASTGMRREGLDCLPI